MVAKRTSRPLFGSGAIVPTSSSWTTLRSEAGAHSGHRTLAMPCGCDARTYLLFVRRAPRPSARAPLDLGLASSRRRGPPVELRNRVQRPAGGIPGWGRKGGARPVPPVGVPGERPPAMSNACLRASRELSRIRGFVVVALRSRAVLVSWLWKDTFVALRLGVRMPKFRSPNSFIRLHHADIRAHGLMDSWTLGCMNTEARGLKDPWTHGLVDSCTPGLMYSWTHAPMDSCTQGPMDSWNSWRGSACLAEPQECHRAAARAPSPRSRTPRKSRSSRPCRGRTRRGAPGSGSGRCTCPYRASSRTTASRRSPRLAARSGRPRCDRGHRIQRPALPLPPVATCNKSDPPARKCSTEGADS